MMNDATKSIKASAEAFNDAVQAIDQLVELPKKARDAYREFRLDSVVSEINERLYGRFELIHAVENFGQMMGPEQDFDEIIKTARTRAKYLEKFNKRVEPRIRTVSPKLAAGLITMTKESIKLYDRLAEVENADRMAEIAPMLANALKEIAQYLERVNDKLKDMTSRT